MNNESTAGVVWIDVLDDRYQCYVTRSSTYVGVLYIFDLEAAETIFAKEVSLSYGALYGPDVDDVIEWQNIIINFIDAECTNDDC